MPNIKGRIGYIDSTANTIIDGAFYNNGSNSTGWNRVGGQSYIKNFDASRSSSTYKDNAKVNPDHIYVNFVIKY